jgi:hypothetical protein
MAQVIRVPKEVMEIFHEAKAASALATLHDSGWFPSLKAIFYAQKAAKARAFAWRALGAAHPATLSGQWVLDSQAGVVTKEEPPEAAKEKKPRKPRAIKPAASAATTEGAKV